MKSTDLRQLADVALEAKANLEIKQADVLADAGYSSASEVSRCVEHGLTPFIPKPDEREHEAGVVWQNRFHYDAVQDVYRCPAGAELTYRFSTYELGRELKYYRAKGCQDCALKSQFHAESSQPHHHARGERTPDGGDGGADAAATRKSSSCGRRWPRNIPLGRSSAGSVTRTF